MTALAENHLAVTQLEPTAITAGQVNGAQFYQHALVTTPGDTDALIYDHAVDGTVASVVFDLGTDKLTGFEYFIYVHGLSHTDGSTQRVRIRYFLETSAVWSAWQNVSGTITNTVETFGFVQFGIMPKGDTILVRPGFTQVSVGTQPVASKMALGVTENVTMIEIGWTAGNIDLGELHIYKSATYVGRE